MEHLLNAPEFKSQLDGLRNFNSFWIFLMKVQWICSYFTTIYSNWLKEKSFYVKCNWNTDCFALNSKWYTVKWMKYLNFLSFTNSTLSRNSSLPFNKMTIIEANKSLFECAIFVIIYYSLTFLISEMNTGHDCCAYSKNINLHTPNLSLNHFFLHCSIVFF